MRSCDRRGTGNLRQAGDVLTIQQPGVDPGSLYPAIEREHGVLHAAVVHGSDGAYMEVASSQCSGRRCIHPLPG